MKHTQKIITILMLSMMVFTSNAQQWCEKGAKWYSQYRWFALTGYREFIYTHDTTINGQSCHIIKTQAKYVDESVPKLIYSPVTETYSYASNGIVYQYGSGVWDTLYNFHVLPGDSFLYFKKNAYITIKDTGHMIKHGFNLQWYSFTYYNQAQFIQMQLDTVFERIGYTGPMSLLEPCFVSDCPENGICNYYDSAFGNLYNNASSCLFIPNGIVDIDYIKFAVFPNPSSGVFTLTSSTNLTQNQTIYLYNSLGKMLRTFTYSQVSGQMLDLSLYSEGVYWMVVGDETIKLVKE